MVTEDELLIVVYLKMSWYSDTMSVRRASFQFILITVDVCSRYPCSNDPCSHAHGDSRPHYFHLYYQVYEGWAHIFITTLCYSIPCCCFSAGILCIYQGCFRIECLGYFDLRERKFETRKICIMKCFTLSIHGILIGWLNQRMKWSGYKS